MADLRMPNINRTCIAGRLTRDPELRFTAGGQALCQFQIAWSREYKHNGETRKEHLFMAVKCFGKTAEYIGENLYKGRPVYVEGRTITDEWEKDGKKQSHTRLIAETVQSMDWGDNRGQQAIPQTQQARQPDPTPEPYDDSDIPF
ncbi:MAG: single-stranded DNA-binding protein [Desulfurellales bacterium]|nr:MAG: single-stranded DNA-binding protein [Desulfurellales bacterium]